MKLNMITSSNGNIPALLAICAGNSPVFDEFPSQRPVTRSFEVFCYLCNNRRLSKQSGRRRVESPTRSLWRHYNESEWRVVMSLITCRVYVQSLSVRICHKKPSDRGASKDLGQIRFWTPLVAVTWLSPSLASSKHVSKYTDSIYALVLYKLTIEYIMQNIVDSWIHHNDYSISFNSIWKYFNVWLTNDGSLRFEPLCSSMLTLEVQRTIRLIW